MKLKGSSMNEITIWHGSEKIIKNPTYGKGKTHNDYGMGFYCTESLELAKEWACKDIGIDGFANSYTLNTDGLNILDLSDKKYHVLNWLAVLADNRDFKTTLPIAKEGKEYLIRNFLIDINQYDLIKGYRADDSYFAFARSFINNQMNISDLEKAMRLGKFGEQIVLKSQIAFAQLEFLGYEKAQSNKYYHKRMKRNLDANSEFVKLLNDADIYGMHMIDIIRKGIKDGDECLRKSGNG